MNAVLDLTLSVEIGTIQEGMVEIAEQTLNGDDTFSMATDILLRCFVEALGDSGIVIPSGTETECFRDPIVIQKETEVGPLTFSMKTGSAVYDGGGAVEEQE